MIGVPDAPPQYSQSDQQRVRTAMDKADKANLKQGKDVFLVQGERLVIKSPNGTQYKIVVSDAGVLSASPA